MTIKYQVSSDDSNRELTCVSCSVTSGTEAVTVAVSSHQVASVETEERLAPTGFHCAGSGRIQDGHVEQNQDLHPHGVENGLRRRGPCWGSRSEEAHPVRKQTLTEVCCLEAGQAVPRAAADWISKVLLLQCVSARAARRLTLRCEAEKSRLQCVPSLPPPTPPLISPAAFQSVIIVEMSRR